MSTVQIHIPNGHAIDLLAFRLLVCGKSQQASQLRGDNQANPFRPSIHIIFETRILQFKSKKKYSKILNFFVKLVPLTSDRNLKYSSLTTINPTLL